jgi:hypothetical protein
MPVFRGPHHFVPIEALKHRSAFSRTGTGTHVSSILSCAHSPRTSLDPWFSNPPFPRTPDQDPG